MRVLLLVGLLWASGCSSDDPPTRSDPAPVGTCPSLNGCLLACDPLDFGCPEACETAHPGGGPRWYALAACADAARCLVPPGGVDPVCANDNGCEPEVVACFGTPAPGQDEGVNAPPGGLPGGVPIPDPIPDP